MGEIMRWRLTRGAQRRIPVPESTIVLDDSFELAPSERSKIESINAKTEFTPLLQALWKSSPLHLNLATGGGDESPPDQALEALMSLDKWLAAAENKPDIAALNAEITTLLGEYLPNSQTWQNLRTYLASDFYSMLVTNAIGTSSSFASIDNLGKATRYLLVVTLVDTLQQNPTPIQTPNQVYAALRWRTPILPDWVVQQLLANRADKGAMLVRKAGFSDLYITREEWDHYEAGEIASIENILGRELKSRVHILMNQTEVTTTTEEVTSSLKEQDTTTTDQSQLQQQSSSDISIAAHVDGQVDTSGLYGQTQINTHLGGSLDYSNASATSKATTQSHETVSRAVSKIEQTTRQVRTISTLTRSTDKEEHKFDNTQKSESVVGIYRWVDKIQNIELDRYPHRLLLEFEIPEPGAWIRWLQHKNASRDMINQPPTPLTLDGNPIRLGNSPLRATDIDADNYALLAARYRAAGISDQPGPLTVAVNIGCPATAETTPIVQDFKYQSNNTVAVPDGHYAESWSASLMYMTGGSVEFSFAQIDVAVGGGKPIRSPTANAVTGEYTNITDNITGGTVGPISRDKIPVAVQVINNTGFQINVEVNCLPLDQTMKKWQNDTYDLIVAAYDAMLQAYNDEKAALAVMQTNPVDANSPGQNAQKIKQDLKRQVIEMLIGTPFSGLGAINWDTLGVNPPTTDWSMAASFAPEIQFLEQAFEWEILSYICYPYYWADSSRWPDLAVIEGNDSNFVDFLRAGSARVVLAARPGFEDQVNFYTQFGILWGGGPMPAPGDPDYLSIADEIKAMQQRPSDVTVVDTWQVRLPTTLIWLENPDGLPKNTNPSIDTKPKIASLSPTSGAVGTSVTITGKNFGDIEGSSTVSFNGTIATPTSWSATSIDVTIPADATTGDVVVTINGVESNGVNFTVNE